MRREQQREQSEQAEEREIKLRLGEALFHQRSHRRDVRDRLLGIEFPDRALDRLRERLDRQRRADQQCGERPCRADSSDA